MKNRKMKFCVDWMPVILARKSPIWGNSASSTMISVRNAQEMVSSMRIFDFLMLRSMNAAMAKAAAIRRIRRAIDILGPIYLQV